MFGAALAEFAEGGRGGGDASDGAFEVREEDDVAGPVVEIIEGRPVVLDVRGSDHGRDGRTMGEFCQCAVLQGG